MTMADDHDLLHRCAQRERVKLARGPLAICVTQHATADEYRELLDARDVVVIPFAASALTYCPGGTKRFRGIVAHAPGHPASDAFRAWVETAIVPYAQDGATVLWL